MSRKPEPVIRQRTPDDEWLNKLRDECARAGARWLKQSLNIKRPIDTLNLVEMSGLTEAITARWIVLVAERPKDEPMTAAQAELYATMLLT